MEIRLNGIVCRSADECAEVANEEIARFYCEWNNTLPYVLGRTSGSTGNPKEIKLIKADMEASARLTNEFFGITDETTMLLCLSPSYIAGKMMMVRAMISGADLQVVSPSSSPLSSLKRIPDFAAMVPMQVQCSLNESETREKLAGIGSLIIGGAPVTPALETSLQTLPVKCYATYGMTETVSHIALRDLGFTDTPYQALGEVTFEIDDRGCLIINTPHLSCSRFVTNDEVRLKDARRFHWLGRHDNVVNSGGVKLFPEEIEQKISECIKRRYFVMGKPDIRLGEKLVLIIEGEEMPPDEILRLQSDMERILIPYQRPKEILFISRFKETYSGKVIRDIQE